MNKLWCFLAGLLAWIGAACRRDDPRPPEPAPDPRPAPGPTPSAPAPATEADELLRLINIVRGSRRHPLAIDARLTAAAQDHARDMAAHAHLSHTGSDRSSVADRVGRHGYPWRALAENIAAGQKTAADVVVAWTRSDGHHANLVMPDATKVGFGVARSAGGFRYWCAVISRPA
jgi:uncharacterized protein YkwD